MNEYKLLGEFLLLLKNYVKIQENLEQIEKDLFSILKDDLFRTEIKMLKQDMPEVFQALKEKFNG